MTLDAEEGANLTLDSLIQSVDIIVKTELKKWYTAYPFAGPVMNVEAVILQFTVNYAIIVESDVILVWTEI